jgi:hypothetical protein
LSVLDTLTSVAEGSEDVLEFTSKVYYCTNPARIRVQSETRGR